jgi:DNA-directed RNA polymerase subunit RPC12/RpoP
MYSARKKRREARPEVRERARCGKLFIKYGITLEDYNSKLKDQNNRCAICKKEYIEGEIAFAQDHCHYTNKNRGILCSNCNRGIGMLQDSVDIIANALQYLEDWDGS